MPRISEIKVYWDAFCWKKKSLDLPQKLFGEAWATCSPTRILHKGLGDALMVLDDPGEAIEQYRLALKFHPQSVDMLNRLARTLATSVNASARDGPEAVRLAGTSGRANAISGRRHSGHAGRGLRRGGSVSRGSTDPA